MAKASNGQETLKVAATYLGSSEGKPNRSGSPIVDECQALYGLQGVPWCACFVGYVISQSAAGPAYKSDAKTMVNPSTAAMVTTAKRRGWYGYGNDSTRPGDLFIIDGLHVGFVWSLLSGGRFSTIEGNSQDSVRSVVRSWRDGWRTIQIPGVGNPVPTEAVDGYGFDDTRVKLYGGWPTPEARDQQMRKYAGANPDHWTQAVRVERDSPYAFRAGPAGTYSHYSYGPWLHTPYGREIRDKEAKRWQTAHKGLPVRLWKRTYKGVTNAR